MAIVAFVGALVVLSIPYAILSVSLPPSINRLGMSVATTQLLLFGRPWYLLVPATLVALWIGLWSYRWCCSAAGSEETFGTDVSGAVGQSGPSVRARTSLEIEQPG